MKNKKLFLSALIIFGISVMGCSTTIAWNKVDLDLGGPPHSQIHNLRNETSGIEIGLRRQIEDIMKIFLDDHGEEFGFYTVDFTTEIVDYNLVLPFVSGLTVFSLNILGMPWTTVTYRLHAFLNIFDSQGNHVQSFENSNSFSFAQGFYYNYKPPTRKVGRIYSELFEDLLRQTDINARLINAVLENAGPITAENLASARARIRRSERPR